MTVALAWGLLQRGFASMLARVLIANPAFFFYETPSGVLVDEKKIEIGRAKLTEVAFGWKDIHKLAQ